MESSDMELELELGWIRRYLAKDILRDVWYNRLVFELS